MKFPRESKSKITYDDFFHDPISELEKIRLMLSSFNPFVPSLPKQQTTANSKQCGNIVFCNKTKPLLVGLH